LPYSSDILYVTVLSLSNNIYIYIYIYLLNVNTAVYLILFCYSPHSRVLHTNIK